MLEIAREYGPTYLSGLGTTIRLSLIGFFFAFLIGLAVAACRVGPVPPLRQAGTLYTELARNTPLTVLMTLSFFVLPDIGFLIPGIPTAILALSIYTGAFLAETFRSGINSVAVGQAEAARSLGLTFPQVLGGIVFPQALRTVVPPIGNLFIAHTKNTSVAYVIGVVELTGAARNIGNATARNFEVFVIAAVIYVTVLIPTGILFGVIERRLAIKR